MSLKNEIWGFFECESSDQVSESVDCIPAEDWAYRFPLIGNNKTESLSWVLAGDLCMNPAGLVLEQLGRHPLSP